YLGSSGLESEEKLEREVFVVGGMACAFCASTIEKGLAQVEGVKSAKVFMESGEVIVEHNPVVVDKRNLKRELQRLGYYVFEGKENANYTILADSRSRALKTWFFAVISFLVAFPIMFRNPFPFLPVSIPGNYGFFGGLANLVIATVVLFYYALPIQRGTIEALKKHILNEHVLYGVAGLGAYALGIIGFFASAYRPFLFIAVLLTGLHLTAGWLGARLRFDVENSVRRLMEIRPPMARLIRGGKEVELPISEVEVGDLVSVRPGEKVPLDGVVVSGASEVSEAILTGESTPVAKEAGDRVLGGSTNGSGAIIVKVTSDFRESYISRILGLVSSAKQTRSTILTFFDRVVDRVWVPLVLTIAAATFVAWSVAGVITANQAYFGVGAINALLVAVIGYPCAIGFSSPSVGLTTFSEFADNGILVKDNSVFERLKDVRTVILDKTGTLTYGKPRVVRVVTAPGIDESGLLRLAASLENESAHPVARAIVNEASARMIPLINVEDFKEVRGAGVTGFALGKRVTVGRPEFLVSNGFERGEVENILLSLPMGGRSPVVVGVDGRVAGVFDVVDAVRPDAPIVVARLKEMGLRVLMVTGDTETTASAIAEEVGGIEYFARKTPEDKLKIVEEFKKRAKQEKKGGKVLVVGDGLNDAAALSAADVGIAMATSIDISKDVADVVLVSNNLAGIVTLLENSKLAARASAGNVLLALSFNAVGIPLALLGALSASEAMLIMVLSLFGVFMNAYITKFRLRRRLALLGEGAYLSPIATTTPVN
ncbi:MAG: cation-translocating P-type ATPase, partial [Thermoprotei archaeon]